MAITAAPRSSEAAQPTQTYQLLVAASIALNDKDAALAWAVAWIDAAEEIAGITLPRLVIASENDPFGAVLAAIQTPAASI